MNESAPPSAPPRRLRGIVILAGTAILVGLWLLLEEAGVAVPSLGRAWPVFVLLGGLVSLVDYLAWSRAPASLGRAIFGAGLAAWLFRFTTRPFRWRELLDFLPALPTLAGLALLATWSVERERKNAHLVSGTVLLALGLVGFAARFEWLRALLPSAQLIWAVLLLLGGGALLWTNLRRR